MGRRRARTALCDLSITPSLAVKKWIKESDVHIDYVIPHEIIPPNAEAKNNGRAVLFLSVRRLTARVGGESGRWASLSRGGSEEAVARLPPQPWSLESGALLFKGRALLTRGLTADLGKYFNMRPTCAMQEILVGRCYRVSLEKLRQFPGAAT